MMSNIHYVLTVFVCVCSAQQNNFGGYTAPPLGHPDYRTYVLNGRRYGQNSPFQNQNINKYGYQQVDTTASPIPGVLAGWRSDLQGKKRPDSPVLPQDVFVTTSYGEVQGFVVNLYDNPDPHSGYRPGQTPVERVQKSVNVFLGIPYAMPPVREGRFMPPRLHRGWQLLQAVDFGPACPQPFKFVGINNGVKDMDEDCLYLNVYSPSISSGLAEKLPVMMYIHGGDFVSGASNTFPGHMLAAFYGVVVVTFNYRLGALGFLSTGDENSPGNYGLLDQAVALKWVYDNIKFFNGDEKSITLFGPDAGAASAGLLAVAPRTRNLVSKVIAQSGSALADWALIVDRYRVQNTSRVFGQLLGCSIETSWKLVNCLKLGRAALELGNALFEPQVGHLAWGPVLDGNFTVPKETWYEEWHEKDWHLLFRTPEEYIKRGEFNKNLMYMTGVTTQEAAYLIHNNETLRYKNYLVDHQFFNDMVWKLVQRYNYTLNRHGIYQAISYMYTHWPDPNNTDFVRDQYINMISDFLYHAPTDKIAKLLVQEKVPVYLYVLNTTVEAFKYPQWRRVPHNIENYFLTGAPFMDVEFFPKFPRLERTMWTDNDRNMSHFFMQAWSYFAKYGNPSYQQILGLHFDMARSGELRYLNINTTFNSSIRLNYRQTEAAFWTMYLPTVIGHLVPTYPPITEYWWEPKQPLQIAFWSVSGFCLLLIVAVVIFCILWRNAKRHPDLYYSGETAIIREDTDFHGAVNPASNYEYKDTPPTPSKLKRGMSVSSNESGVSLKDNLVSGMPLQQTPKSGKIGHANTRVDNHGVPQTDV